MFPPEPSGYWKQTLRSVENCRHGLDKACVHPRTFHLTKQAQADGIFADLSYGEHNERIARGISPEQDGDIMRDDMQLAVIADIKQPADQALVDPSV